MKRSMSLIAAGACMFAGLLGTAQAARMTQADVMKQISGIVGTYACGAGKTAHTSTFGSMLGGHGLSIAETAGGGSAQQVIFDTRRQKWIDQYVDAQGNYSVMEGTPVKHGIDFVGVYPAGYNAALAVRMPSSGKMTTSYKMTMNGKTSTENEACTKR